MSSATRRRHQTSSGRRTSLTSSIDHGCCPTMAPRISRTTWRNGCSAMTCPRPRSSVPMTQGKIERWHQTLKNRILLENYYLPGDLEAQIEAFVADYDYRRYHKSIDNLTPADVYFGRGQTILLQRERIKRQTIARRRLQHQRQAA